MDELVADQETVRSLIGVTGTIAVALITTIGARLFLGRKPKPSADPDGSAPAIAPSPLTSFSGTQNEFMALVIQDNAIIRGELEKVRAAGADTQAQVDELSEALEKARAAHTSFQLAVRRYLARVAVYIEGLGGSMPHPEGEDLGILEHTLPRHHRRST